MKTITVLEQAISVPEEFCKNIKNEFKELGRYGAIERVLKKYAPSVLTKIQPIPSKKNINDLVSIWQQLGLES